MKSSSICSVFSFSKKHSGFTLVELIVVITILAILAAVGFVIMSHQTSVARDGKRISEIQSLSSASRITTAQLRKLPRPIADSLELTVSGSFIGYQGFMSTALVNPIGYGSDKIYDPLDGIPYTYRVNKNYDQAQFMAYLENPRFERNIEIALQSLPSLVSEVSALDTSSIDFSKKYPYAIGDKLGIFIDKNTRTPLQSGVTGIGSRDISLSDSGSIDIIVGANGDDSYVSTKISNSVLTSLVDGSFGNDALLAMNTNTPENNSTSYILTMGEYSIMGNTYYGYVGPLTIGVYAGLGVNITTITPGSLVDDTVDGYVIDTFILDSNYQSPVTILAGGTDMPSNITFETPYASIACTPQSSFLDVTPYGCTGSTSSTDFYVGSQHDLGITFPATIIPPSLPAPNNVTDAPLNTDVISNVVTASNISSPVNISITNGELRINGGSWVTSGQITNNGDQVEYRTQVTQDGERKLVTINLNSINSEWIVDAYSCFSTTDGNPNTTMIASYNNTCVKNVVIPSVIFGKNVVGVYNNAFSGSQLTSVVIPNSVLYITEGAFANNQLTSVTIPNGVTGIGKSAFANNQLTSVTIGTGVTHIYDYAFMDNQLTSVTIPNGVTHIDYMAFRNNQLTSIIIPDSMISIGDWAFRNNQLTSLNLGNSVQAIHQGAFYQNQLTSANIPNSVNFIGSEAFRDNALTSIIIPGSVDYIGDSAFRGNFITSVVIENNLDNLTYIASYAFNGNSLTSVTIPNSVGDIGGFAFADQWNSAGNGTVYGPSAGYVKDRYINDGNNWVFDKTKLPNYVDLP